MAMEEVLTTSEVAKICNVSARTVARWVDSNRLVGFRVPGSRNRRIPKRELLLFMKTHNMDMSELEKNH